MRHALRPGASTLTSQLDPVRPAEPGLAPGRRTLVEAAEAQGRVAPAQARPGAGGLRTGEPGAPGGAASSGQPLPGDVRSKMERAFGADFAAVRIHEGPDAAAAGAEAFTRGDALHFRPGAYDPHGAAGQELLGHELAHVVQQRAGRVAMPQGKGGFVVDAGLEAEADAAGARAARGEPARVTGASNATSAPAWAAQPKLYLGGKSTPEAELPAEEEQRLLPIYDQATITELKQRIAIPRKFPHADWDDAAAAAFRATRAQVDPEAQSPLWYGKDSAARNIDPDGASAPGAGQFRESSESRALADKLLAKLGELRKKDTLGKGAEGQWKEAIMVGVMITVLGKKYAAKSGAMTTGFQAAALALGLEVVDPKDDRIRGFSSPPDRSKDPVAQAVASGKPEASPQEVGQAPGKCAMPKLLSAVAGSKNDTPESATEKLFAPDQATEVYVQGEGGEVARHGHGCSVPSCITCRMLTELQLEGAPSRDQVLSDAETGYVAHLDARSTQRNQAEDERVAAAEKTNRNRRKQKKAEHEIAPAKHEPTDRGETWQTISERVAAAATQIGTRITAAATPPAPVAKPSLGAWNKPLPGVSAAPPAFDEAAAAGTCWRDQVSPAIAALSADLERDYGVSPFAFPASTATTLAGLRKHVDQHLPQLEDRARSAVARKFGAL